MPVATPLRRVVFTTSHLSHLANFDCGDQPWEREMTEWIRADDGALEHQARGGDVWLYVTEAGEIVGFGALGLSHWRWPTSKDRPSRVSVIAALGVDKRFQGQPPGPPEQRYAAQILRNLIAEAAGDSAAEQLVGLFVHPENARAIRFCERAGFQHFFRTYTDPDTGVTYRSMVLQLPERA